MILRPRREEGLAALPGWEEVGMGIALWNHGDLEGEKYKGGRGDTERGDVKLLSVSNGVKVRSLLNTSLSWTVNSLRFRIRVEGKQWNSHLNSDQKTLLRYIKPSQTSVFLFLS